MENPKTTRKPRTKKENICNARFEANDMFYNYNTIIPVEDHPGIKATRKRLRFPYRWTGEDEDVFEIYIDGHWREAQSIDFIFLD